MRICKNCGSEFVGKRSDASYCSVNCGNRFRNKRHYAANPEKFTASRKWYNSHVEKRILSRIKHKAKRFGIEFDIDVSDIVVPDNCPILGMPLVKVNQGSGYHTNSPSLDRIDPEKGYTKGNVRVISARANLLKNDASSTELRLILKDLEGLGL